jgi:hypothetical protein
VLSYVFLSLFLSSGCRSSIYQIHYLPQILRPHSLLTNLVIDYEVIGAGGGDGSFYGFQHQTQQTCDDAFLYITDTAGAAIVVYDVRRDAVWRVFDPSMLPHPDHSTYYVSTNNASARA